MRKIHYIYLVILLFAAPASIRAQEIKVDSIPAVNDDDSADQDYDKVFSKVEKRAEFPGGDNGWKDFVSRNINTRVPIKHRAPAGQYRVVIKFTIDKDGHVMDVTAETDPGYGMAEEAIRVIKKSPKRIPAEQMGRVVKSRKSQPFIFQVD